MRYILAFTACLASPAISEPSPTLDSQCMTVVAKVAYAPSNFETGVLAGMVMGYAVARGFNEAEAEQAARTVAAICRDNPGMTFRESLTALDQD